MTRDDRRFPLLLLLDMLYQKWSPLFIMWCVYSIYNIYMSTSVAMHMDRPFFNFKLKLSDITCIFSHVETQFSNKGHERGRNISISH